MKAFYKAMIACAAVALAVPGVAGAQDNALADKAKSEGRVSVYTSTDISQAQSMIDAFKKKYPGIEVDYNDLGTNGVYNRVISEKAANQVGADVVWTSAMDLQMKLAIDGYLQPVDLKATAKLPEWANYKDMLYATSVEPVGIIYNKNEVSEEEVPKTRAELIEFLKSDKAKGRVATFDPEKSGTGFLFHTNDAQTTDNFWDLAEAFGQANGKTYSSSGAMKETVVSGENILAFNVIGSYALDWVKESKNLGVAFEQDRTAAFSRLIGMTEGAPHPAAGQLFMAFVLSKEGQTELAKNGLPSIRSDVDAGFNLDTINKRVGGHIQPIAVNEDLVSYMKPMKRAEFLKKWESAAR